MGAATHLCLHEELERLVASGVVGLVDQSTRLRQQRARRSATRALGLISLRCVHHVNGRAILVVYAANQAGAVHAAARLGTVCGPERAAGHVSRHASLLLVRGVVCGVAGGPQRRRASRRGVARRPAPPRVGVRRRRAAGRVPFATVEVHVARALLWTRLARAGGGDVARRAARRRHARARGRGRRSAARRRRRTLLHHPSVLLSTEAAHAGAGALKTSPAAELASKRCRRAEATTRRPRIKGAGGRLRKGRALAGRCTGRNATQPAAARPWAVLHIWDASDEVFYAMWRRDVSRSGGCSSQCS